MRLILTLSVLILAGSVPFTSASGVDAAAAPQFIIGAAGRMFPDAPAGYILATLADIKGSSFTSGYAAGLPDSGESRPSSPARCPLVAVQGGFLTVGPLADPQFVGPFGATQQLQNTTNLVPPIWFGTLAADGRVIAFLPSLPPHVLTALRTTPIPSQLPFCTPDAYLAVFIRATFFVAGWGQDFPPSTQVATLASTEDLQSGAFVSQYNSGQLREHSSSQLMSGCCVFATADGYLRLGAGGASVVPYSSPSSSGCGKSSIGSGAVWFGTDSGGFIGLLNATTVASLSGSAALPPLCPSSTVDTWGLFKAHPSTTPPNEGNCVLIDLQVSWYVPNTVSPCLADRWRYYLPINRTVDSIAMSDFNTCGYTIDINSFLVTPYDDAHMVAHTAGATRCKCAGKAVFPLARKSEMTVVCSMTINTYGFCQVLVDYKDRVRCP